MLDHFGIQCADIAASAAFYEAVLAPLGGTKLMDFEVAKGYGVAPEPDFWISTFESGEGFRESHIAFSAPNRAAVQALLQERRHSGFVLHDEDPGHGQDLC